MIYVIIFVATFACWRTCVYIDDRRSRLALERETSATIIESQRALIHKATQGSVWSIDPVSGEQRRPIKGGNHLETQHDAAFEAAWIEPSAALIAKIDRELGIEPAPILDDAPAPTALERRTGYTPAMSPREAATYAAWDAKALEVVNADLRLTGWERESDGSWTQVAMPVATPRAEGDVTEVTDWLGTVVRREPLPQPDWMPR